MNETKKISVGIYGAASFVAGKLLELLANHPLAGVSRLVSNTFIGQRVEAAHPSLRNVYDMTFTEYSASEFASACDLVFLTKPHGQAMEIAAELIDNGLKVIDLSADYRLNNPGVFEQWYGTKHTKPDLLKQAVYGLPELNAEAIVLAKLTANPGCYPTAAILALAPLCKEQLIDTDEITISAISGASGAGRSSEETQYLNVEQNLKPYKIGIHPHTPEMEQELSALADTNVRVSFVPHIASFKYGILMTIHTKLNANTTEKELTKIYENFYRGKGFIRVLSDSLPQLLDVVGTNFCDISVRIDRHSEHCIINAAIDNAIKGASGEAVQNMNLMFGFDEGEGLPYGQKLKNR